MYSFDLSDAIESYRVLDIKIADMEKEIKQLQKMKLNYYKAQAEVVKKLNNLCDHEWFKIATHAFSPSECSKCGVVKDLS